MDTKMNIKLDLLSLFSGGGFLDIGFINQGYTIKQAVEIHPSFIQAYNEGVKSVVENSKFSNGHIAYTPITEITDASSPVTHKLLAKKHKGISGIIGGPPCQDYSVGGNNVGMTGERGKLIYSYFEIVKKVKPDFIFFENVPGLYKTKIHKVAFDDLVSRLENAGYVVWFDILNSLQYGIPQDRPRLTMVGFKKEIVTALKKAGYKKDGTETDNLEKLIFKWPKKTFENPKSLVWPKKWAFGSVLIKKDTKEIPKEYESLQIINAFKGLNKNSPNQDEFFVPKSSRFKSIEEGDTNRKSFKRLHRFRYSPTVAYGNNEVHLHPTEARRLSVREALRLQSVPDSYILPKNMPLSHKFKLISNGVPTHKATLIAGEIKRTLINYYSLING